MKKDIFYTLRRHSFWVTMSGVLMGIPFLIQAIYFLLIRSVVDVPMMELMTYMAIPMAVEFVWCLMIHVLPMRNTSPVAGVATAVFLVLIWQSLFYGDLVRTLLAALAYVAVIQLVLLILTGRFPYRLFGSVGMLVVLALRVLLFTYPVYIAAANWKNLLIKELPGLCMLAAIYCIFGAIEPHKKDNPDE